MFHGDEVAVVTGASRGIGKAIALELAQKGVTVVLTYVQRSDQMEATLEEIRRVGGNGMAVQADLADEHAVKKLFKDVKTEFKKIDILVNNGGITKDGFLPLMSSAKWDDVMNVNLRGTYLCTREAVKQMMVNKKGAIVNVSSTSGVTGARGQANYAASKGGVIAFTKSLALEVAPYHIRANVVAPGFIETDMTKAMDKATLERMLDLVPLQRMGKPEEVAKLVSFLSSSDSSYITGKVFTIDGGLING